MLYSEFTKRVGINVSADEFESINNVYMLTDVDKDEFCKLWAKMNFKRIKAHKEQIAKEKKEANSISFLRDLHDSLVKKLNKDLYANFHMLAITAIGTAKYKKVVDAMHICGIVEIDEYCPLGYYIQALDNKITEYWEKVASEKIA